MSTEENSNNIDTLPLNSITNDNNIKISDESLKEQNHVISNKQKLKNLKQNLKVLLQKTLGKTLLNLETNNQIQLQSLTITTKSFKEFNSKINLMKNQVEENIKKKEESKKIKKIKVSKAKFRSRTAQKGNINNKLKIQDDNKNNETNKSLIKTRAKTTRKNDIRIQNSEKKSIKNKNMLIKKQNNNELYHTIKNHSSKLNLTEQNNKKTSRYLNKADTNNKMSTKNLKARKNSKNIKNTITSNNSRTKLNIIYKSEYDLKSNSNLLSDTKEKTEKGRISKKSLINKKNLNIDYRKSFDFSNSKILKSKVNNYKKKNTEIFIDKSSSSKKIIKNNNKNNRNNTINSEINIKTEEDTDTIINRFEKQKELLEKIRKQREENNLIEEAKKRDIEKEKEEQKKFEEERKKRDLEIKRKEEERKKELEEQERKNDEERRKKQMEIEAKIEKEKIEKENMKKELERQKELEKQKKLKEERIKKEKEEEERIRKEKEEEEKIKQEEMEKLKLEMDKMKEEEIIELPNNMELNINNKDNLIEENKNKDMNIQDLLEIEEKNDQNFEYFHIKDDIEKEKDIPIIEPEEKIIEEKENKENKDITKTDELKKENNPKILYRNISILELIHDVPKFSPILFEFLSLNDCLEFTSISKKIKRQRIYIFNLQKKIILNNIGIKDESNLDKNIKEYEEKYSNDELNEPYIEFHLSRGAARAVQLLNNNTYSKIFRRPVLDSNLSQIYIAYKILLVFLGEINIAKISENKIFWVKCTEYLNSNSENGKIGDYIMNKFEKYNCDCKTIYYIEKLLEGKKDNISPSNFSKICGSTGLLIFLIKELLEYCGVIISPKKTQLSRIYQNLLFFKNIIDKLSEFNKILENFNQ